MITTKRTGNDRRRRVAVTGIGCVTPTGHGTEGLWAGLRERRSAVRRVTRFDPGPFRSQMAAEVDRFDPCDYMEAKRARRLDRFGHFSVAAAHMAIHDSGLDPGTVSGDRVAVQMGSALGGIAYAESQHQVYMSEGPNNVDPMLALIVFTGAASCNIAIEFGFTGPNSTNGMSCASGAIAVGQAFRLIRDGEADVALAGGVECPLSPLTYGAFALIRAMSKRNDDPATASRPFDRDRDGFVLGEGAAVLVLEREEHARARGAEVYAEVRGYATNCDAHSMMQLDESGEVIVALIKDALRVADVGAGEIDHVSAHGTSTIVNDRTESKALRLMFGGRADDITVTGLKSMTGHGIGASGPLETAALALGIRHHIQVPTINYETPDPECDVNVVANVPRQGAIQAALKLSYGFGGHNACLVLIRA